MLWKHAAAGELAACRLWVTQSVSRLRGRCNGHDPLAFGADSTAIPLFRGGLEQLLGVAQGFRGDELALGAQAARLFAGAEQVDVKAHGMSVAADIKRWIERGELPTPSPAPRAPPGDPFGDGWPEPPVMP